MKRKKFIRKDEEGVSPVIATILMVAITVVLAAVLYIMVIGLTPPGRIVPKFTWGAVEVVGPTAVNIDFGMFSSETRPVDLQLVLIRNSTTEGKYSFSNNDDGALTLTGGANLGTLTYADLADNGKANMGDRLLMTNLATGSDYTITMIWGQTGDEIASKDFSTPGF